MLKGALALDFRLTINTRTTKDINLGRGDDEEAAIRDITAAQQLTLDADQLSRWRHLWARPAGSAQ